MLCTQGLLIETDVLLNYRVAIGMKVVGKERKGRRRMVKYCRRNVSNNEWCKLLGI